MLAPIVLFVYSRLEQTKETVNALINNLLASESDLYIYSDGAKDKSQLSFPCDRSATRYIAYSSCFKTTGQAIG